MEGSGPERTGIGTGVRVEWEVMKRDRLKVAIAGAGISGLSAAYYLEQACRTHSLDCQIELFEKSDRLGGVIRSDRVNGFVLEAGPEGWASYKPAGKRLVAELGLTDELIGSRDEVRKTWIVRNEELTELPDGMMFLAPIEPLAFWRSAPLSLKGKMRASLEPFVLPSRGDVSVREFFERRLGREFTDTLVEPLISAIYGADFEELSAPSSLPELHRAEQRKGSLWRGLRRFASISRTVSVLITLREGMEQLVEALVQSLEQTRIHTGVDELRLFERNGTTGLTWKGGEEEFDSVILATPALPTADILEPLSSRTSSMLREIPYGSSTLVYLGYRADEFSHPLDGFGFIVPSSEELTISACTWVNSKFDHRVPEESVLLRAAVHGNGGASADQLAERAHDEVSRIMEFECHPVFHRSYRVEQTQPKLLVGHQKRLSQIKQELSRQPGIRLAGSYLGGVGIPDCIQTGKRAGESIVEEILNSQ